MSIIITRPISTRVNTMTIVPSGTAHAALSDESDSTYVYGRSHGDRVITPVALPSLPSGAKLVSVAMWARVNTLDALVAQAYFDLYDMGASSPNLIHVTRQIGPSATSSFIGEVPLSNLPASPEVRFYWLFGEPLAYELWVAWRHVEVPELTVDGPTGTLTTTNRPTVSWTPNLDPDGGPQTWWQARIVDQDANEVVEAAMTMQGSHTSWRPEAGLPDGSYRSDVWVGQTVNGVAHWSPVVSKTFSVDVATPGVPLVAASGEDAEGRIRIEVEETAGGADTDWWDVETAPSPAGPWRPLRTLLPGGAVTNPTPGSDGTATIWDYEAGNEVTTYYRARAVTDHGDGLTVSSDWSAIAWASWTSTAWWLKHPTDPAKNSTVTVFSLPGFTRPSRQGRFQGLGSSRTIVISDRPGADQGEIVLDMDGPSDRADLDALLDTLAPLLLQAPQGTHWTDRWVVLGDFERRATVDKLAALDSHDTLTWVEVERPEGDIEAWPT